MRPIERWSLGEPSLLPRKRPRPGFYIADPSELLVQPHSEAVTLFAPKPLEYTCARKLWELDFIADCAAALGLMSPDKRALGLGSGKEALIYYFARHLGEVVATDLYSSDTQWNEARSEGIEEVYNASPFPYPRERLKIYSSDMREVPEPDASFDMLWSCGSIEHVPTLRDIHKVFLETHRLLKPGGYAIFTTEFCISEPPYLIIGLNALDRCLADTLVGSLGGLELVGPRMLDYNWLAPAGAPQPRAHILNAQPTNLYSGYVARDFVHITGISAIAPVGFVLRKTGPAMRAWEDLPLPPFYRDYEELRVATPERAIEMLTPIFASGPSSAPYSKQLEILLYAVYVNALSAKGQLEAEHIRRVQTIIPQGSLQDSTMMQFFASLAVRVKEYALAVHFAILAALSPGNLPADSIKAAMNAFDWLCAANYQEQGSNLLALVIKDLIARGWAVDQARETLFSCADGLEPPRRDAAKALFTATLEKIQSELKIRFEAVR